MVPLTIYQASPWLDAGGVCGIKTQIAFCMPEHPDLPIYGVRYFNRRGLVGRSGKANVMPMLKLMAIVEGRKFTVSE